MADNNMLVAAITGGIGSGKSEVARIVAESGYTVINTDVRAKELMAENEDVRRRLIDEFGPDIYNKDGSVNKQFIAAKVFGKTSASHQALDRLNRIVHPAVIDDMIAALEGLRSEGESIAFVESALVFESGIADGFDYVIAVDAPAEVRLDRILERGGISREEAVDRMREQMSPEEKTRRADFTIDNSGTKEDLRRTVDSLLQIVANLPPKDFSGFGEFAE
jgi:dephospho-CoA kinase